MDIKIYENKKLDEKLYLKELESGLKIYFIPKTGYTKKYAILATNYGSTDNSFIDPETKEEVQLPAGIAHFLEHKLFQEPEGDIFHRFSDLGGDANAFTSFNRTAYLFETDENFHENLETLIKFVQKPYFTDENIEKERGIIRQEINMYRDSAGWRVFFNCLNALYKEHPVRIDIAGSSDSIEEINRELLYKAYNTFYNPSNMILVVSGDLEFQDIVHTVESSQKKDFPKVDKISRNYGDEDQALNKKIIEEKMSISKPVFHIGIKDNDLGLRGEEQVKKEIVTNLILDLLFSSSSNFYNDYYDRGLINSSFGAYYTGQESYGYSLILGESKDPKLVYEEIIKLLEKDIGDILREEDFIRIKKNAIGDFLMGSNSIEFLANNFVDYYFQDFIFIDYLDLLESVKYEDLIERFKDHMRQENMVLSIINPLEK